MANFDFNFEKNYVPGHSPRDAQIALQYYSKRVGMMGRDMVTDIAKFGEGRMKAHAPEGPTGNLRRAIVADTMATPLKDVGGTGRFIGGAWEARVSIKGPPEVYLYDRREPDMYFHRATATWVPGQNNKGKLVDVREYALAVNDGRRALSMPFDARGSNETRKMWFRWVNGEGMQKFTKHLRARPGSHFIEKTNADVAAEAEIRTRNFRLR